MFSYNKGYGKKTFNIAFQVDLCYCLYVQLRVEYLFRNFIYYIMLIMFYYYPTMGSIPLND